MWNNHYQTRPVGGLHEAPAGDAQAARYISYDYVTRFALSGEVGQVREDVINISVEGVFVAQEIGYGFAAERAEPVAPQSTADDVKVAAVTLDSLPLDVLVTGFRFNPNFVRLAFPSGSLDPNLTVGVAKSDGLFQRIKFLQELHFLFQIIDSGSGRELQNEPIHNIAGLGKSNGERPFRVLAKPVAFLPRSTIRIQVQEATLGAKGELFIALHGYKILGAADVSEAQLRIAPALQRATAFYGSEKATMRILQQVREGRIPRQRLVPFDYVATFDLEGRPENLAEDEIHINVEGGFVCTAIGYSLSAPDGEIPVDLSGFTGDLGTITLDKFPAQALQQGFRIRPGLVSIAFQNGQLATTLPQETIQLLFEPPATPEDVRFKFRILDTGTGRELQNRPELNIAGLGIANGDRPFRELAYPMHFLPRSTIRVQVEEIAGHGQLFIVFQGYKILHASKRNEL